MIETMTGRVTTKGQGSMQINMFFRKPGSKVEQPLFLAEKDPQSGVKVVGQVEVVPSTSIPGAGMIWSKKRYDMDDGSHIKVQINRSSASGAFRASQHQLVLRYRRGAPLNQIGVQLPTDQRASVSVAYIIGRFDVLTTKEIKDLGVHVNQAGVNELETYDPEEYYDFITIEQLEAATSKFQRPKLTSVKTGGSNKQVLSLKRRRKILT